MIYFIASLAVLNSMGLLYLIFKVNKIHKELIDHKAEQEIHVAKIIKILNILIEKTKLHNLSHLN
jgi:hypothetical protein